VTGSKLPLAYFGVDNVAAGEAMANYVISKFPNGAKIVFLTGQLGSSTANERIKGVHNALEAGGVKYKIVAEQSGDFSRARALTVTQNILSSLPDGPDAIIASNDDMAFGVLQAMQEAGISEHKILVVGLDALPEALPLIRDGLLAASVEDPLAQATTAVDAFVDSLRNKTPLTGKVLGARTIDRSNVTSAERWNEVK
jgi:inositol transport system substrate-binding protein